MSEEMTVHKTISQKWGRGWGRQRPGWCSEHEDFAWGYDDGSVSCFHQCIVEQGTSECVFVPGRLLLPRGTIKRRAVSFTNDSA